MDVIRVPKVCRDDREPLWLGHLSGNDYVPIERSIALDGFPVEEAQRTGSNRVSKRNVTASVVYEQALTRTS